MTKPRNSRRKSWHDARYQAWLNACRNVWAKTPKATQARLLKSHSNPLRHQKYKVAPSKESVLEDAMDEALRDNHTAWLDLKKVWREGGTYPD